MKISPAIVVGLALTCVPAAQAENSTRDAQDRTRAAQLVNEISDPDQRARALALLSHLALEDWHLRRRTETRKWLQVRAPD